MKQRGSTITEYTAIVALVFSIAAFGGNYLIEQVETFKQSISK